MVYGKLLSDIQISTNSPTIDPNTESEEIQVSLSFHWIPSYIWVSFLEELSIRLETTTGQVDSNLL